MSMMDQQMSLPNKQPSIQSIGPPPEKHADRVVAEMLRWTVAAQTKRWDTIQEIFKTSYDGNPKSQRKMVKRIEAAGGAFFYHIDVETGKRGRYTINILDVSGWDPATTKPILDVASIPEKPWLSCNITKIRSKGNNSYAYQEKTTSLLLITHHAMSRLAQRCGARKPRDLLTAVHSIWSSYIAIRMANEGSRYRVLPDDYRLKFDLHNKDHAWAVLSVPTDDRTGLVVTTILPPDAV